MAGMFAGKGEIGPSRCLKCRQGRGLIFVIGVLHQIGEHRKALLGSLCDQIFTAFEMAIDCRRGDARLFCRLGQGKAGRAFCLDQTQRRFHKGLTQVAVMIAAFTHSRCPVRHR